MPEILDEFHAEKHSIVDEMFVATADDNYVLARWSFHQRLNVDFFWLAVHCLEKYLKAVLLLNGENSTGYSHDLPRLYEAVKQLAPELLPSILKKPEARMPPEYWREETPEAFLTRLYASGQADNRYQVFGFSRHAEDLWKLDMMAFAIRRLCKVLNAYELGKANLNASNRSNRSVLLEFQTRWRINSRLEKTLAGEFGDDRRVALTTWNFAFAPDTPQPRSMEYSFASSDSVLVRRLYDPLRGGPDEFAHNDCLWLWVKQNIKLPSLVIREIEGERARLKQEFGKKDEGTE